MFALLVNDTVRQLFSSDPEFAVPVVDVSAYPDIAEGWVRKSDGTFAAPPVPSAVVPQVIQRRQFFQQLAIASVITEDEALAAISSGAIPSEMAKVVSDLPADQQFGAKMRIMGDTYFNRQDPFVTALAVETGMSAAQADAIWINGALL
jgi:hypothetical protein